MLHIVFTHWEAHIISSMSGFGHRKEKTACWTTNGLRPKILNHIFISQYRAGGKSAGQQGDMSHATDKVEAHIHGSHLYVHNLVSEQQGSFAG